MTQPLRVDVPALRALGGEVDRTGAGLGRDVSAVTGQLGAAGGSGWSSTAALTAAVRGWDDFLRGLSDRTAGAGRSLVAAADNYQASDQRAAGRNRGPSPR